MANDAAPFREADWAPVGLALSIVGVRKAFITRKGQVVPALAHVDLRVRRGEVVAILGPSGCGKSTLLRILASLDTDYQGRIEWHAPEGKADTPRLPSATVFQVDSTLPWMSVEDNVVIGCAGLRLSKSEKQARATRYLDLVGLAQFQRSFPHELSGGMRQRVAIARALAAEPVVLLMDEPLAALDAQTRIVMQQELLGIWRKTGSTVIYITHDMSEALTLADRVLVMTRRPGAIKSERTVPFGRDRNAIELRKRHEFGDLEVELWNDLAEEVGQDLRGGKDTAV
jgi:ABC-type nitrate/sulfonate/bicarbonate transport system ATPase subunit